MNMMFPKLIKVALPRFFLVAAAAAVSACGPSVRTADGDCYYRGKGLLQLGGTLLDGAAAYADAVAEQAYQNDQIALQQLSAKLDSIDVAKLERWNRHAYAVNDAEAMTHSDAAIDDYNSAVNEERMLKERIRDYQIAKDSRLQEGPVKSFSQIVADSGDCPD